ncbi:MAG: VWA domain-containing protein [Bacteroidetes bacterium]|nr:MAG: VWA domain-containing protein [Bacteroidota bacterium]
MSRIRKKMRVVPPENYLLPSRKYIRKVAREFGLKNYSATFVRDVASLFAGGRVKREDEIEYDAYHIDKHHNYNPTQIDYGQKKVAEFLKGMMSNLDLSSVPGSSPLEKAVSVVKLLTDNVEKNGGDQRVDTAGDGSVPLPIFAGCNIEHKGREVKDLVDDITDLDPEEAEMLEEYNGYEGDSEGDGSGECDNDDSDDEEEEEGEELDDGEGEPESSPVGDGSRSGGSGAKHRVKVAKNFIGERERTIVEFSRVCDRYAKMNVKKTRNVERDPNSNEFRSVPVDLSSLDRLLPEQWVEYKMSKTLFYHKVLSGEIRVRERVRYEEKKQFIFILLDVSGSMEGRKFWKATGVIMNRLRAVIDGEARLMLATFDSCIREIMHVATKEDAESVMRELGNSLYSGGSTNVSVALSRAVQIIEEEKKSDSDLDRVEIVILTDEDSSAKSMTVEDLKGYKLHAFVFEAKNQYLVNLAEESGGVGLQRL